MKKLIIAWTTTKMKEDALKVAQGLTQGKLIACAQLSSPMTSLCWWEGKIDKDEECRLAIKLPKNLQLI